MTLDAKGLGVDRHPTQSHLKARSKIRRTQPWSSGRIPGTYTPCDASWYSTTAWVPEKTSEKPNTISNDDASSSHPQPAKLNRTIIRHIQQSKDAAHNVSLRSHVELTR